MGKVPAADAAHRGPVVTRRPRSGGVLLALGLALCAAVPAEQARAQNLILDPYFTNGVPAYGTTDAAGNTYYTASATPTTFDGVTGIVIPGNTSGYFEVDPIAGFNNNGVDYAFSFLAAVTNPDVPTTLNASFGPVSNGSCSDCDNTIISPFITSNGLTQYTLTGASTTQFGNFSFLYVQNAGSGDVFVTGLDFGQQGAPAPVPGAGILSLCAALAFHWMRRRVAA